MKVFPPASSSVFVSLEEYNRRQKTVHATMTQTSDSGETSNPAVSSGSDVVTENIGTGRKRSLGVLAWAFWQLNIVNRLDTLLKVRMQKVHPDRARYNFEEAYRLRELWDKAEFAKTLLEKAAPATDRSLMSMVAKWEERARRDGWIDEVEDVRIPRDTKAGFEMAKLLLNSPE